MDAFIFEEAWDVIGRDAAPYFDITIGFYRYLDRANFNIINEEINDEFQVRVVNGRWALVYQPRKYREIN